MSNRVHGPTAIAAVLALAAGLAPRATAGPVGITLFASTGGAGNATYASAPGLTGFDPNGGLITAFTPFGVVTPSAIPLGRNNQAMTVSGGGPAVATGSADLALDAVRAFADSSGTITSCGGTCTTTGLSATGYASVTDIIHYTITDAAPSAAVVFHYHLDGVVDFGAATSSSINQSFIVSVDSTGFEYLGIQTNGVAPTFGSQVNPFAPTPFGGATFSNQSVTGFDFTGTFNVINGQASAFFMSLQVACQSGAVCDFLNTGYATMTVPSDVTFTSDSGLFGTEAIPEPASTTLVLLSLGLAAIRKLK